MRSGLLLLGRGCETVAHFCGRARLSSVVLDEVLDNSALRSGRVCLVMSPPPQCTSWFDIAIRFIDVWSVALDSSSSIDSDGPLSFFVSFVSKGTSLV